MLLLKVGQSLKQFMVSSILQKNERNLLSWASSLLFSKNWGHHKLLSRFTDLYMESNKPILFQNNLILLCLCFHVRNTQLYKPPKLLANLFYIESIEGQEMKKRLLKRTWRNWCIFLLKKSRSKVFFCPFFSLNKGSLVWMFLFFAKHLGKHCCPCYAASSVLMHIDPL